MPSPKKRRFETNGMVASAAAAAPTVTVPSTVATPPAAPPQEVTAASATPSPKHQTDGAYIPMSGPITNVRQIVRGPNVARGSIESFGSLADYTSHLQKLSLADLHRHAVEEARVTPIDDSQRLIRRLQNNWTEVAARERMRQGQGAPKREGFTKEQIEKQDAIRRRMLGTRA